MSENCKDCGYDYSNNTKCACKKPKGGLGHVFSVELGCASISTHITEEFAIKAARKLLAESTTTKGMAVIVMDYSGPKPRECWYRVKR